MPLFCLRTCVALGLAPPRCIIALLTHAWLSTWLSHVPSAGLAVLLHIFHHVDYVTVGRVAQVRPGIRG